MCNSRGQQTRTDDSFTLFKLVLRVLGQDGTAPVMDFGQDGFGDSGARGIGFQAAPGAASTDASPRIDGHMPDLARRSGQPGIHTPILHNARADAGANKYTDKCTISLP